jgi:hypothetical protein
VYKLMCFYLCAVVIALYRAIRVIYLHDISMIVIGVEGAHYDEEEDHLTTWHVGCPYPINCHMLHRGCRANVTNCLSISSLSLSSIVVISYDPLPPHNHKPITHNPLPQHIKSTALSHSPHSTFMAPLPGDSLSTTIQISSFSPPASPTRMGHILWG